MTSRVCSGVIYFSLIIGLFGLLLVLVNPAPVLAGPGLPPRPFPSHSADDEAGDRQGAVIVLQAYPELTEMWTVVQWQDDANNWHDVAGWQGSLEDDGRKQWWVAPKDFGTGPFRWLVFKRKEGALLATSDPFHLPSEKGQVVTIITNP